MTSPAGVEEAPAPYRFNWDEVLHMVEAGVLGDEPHVELIEGELIHMSPQSVLHVRVSRWLMRFLFRELAPTAWTVTAQAPAVLEPYSAPEPDIYVFPASIHDRDLTGPDIALAVEVAVSSLAFDLGRKARLYARHGVREYWVVDAEARRFVVHREPGADGYGSVETQVEPASISPLAIPGLAVAVGDMPSD